MNRRRNITPTVKNQIVMRFDDAVKSWFDTAFQLSQSTTREAAGAAGAMRHRQALHQCELHRRAPHRLRALRLRQPRHDGLCAGAADLRLQPLRTVSRVRKRGGLRTSARSAALNVKCAKSAGDCHWRQLDVIFVHWSGRWEPVRPGRWNWDSTNNKIQEPYDRCPQCGQTGIPARNTAQRSRHRRMALRVHQLRRGGHGGWHKHDPDTLEIVEG